MSALLLVSSAAALALLVVHSWRTRGRFVTLAFFISGAAFGILRGNAIYYLCKLLSGGAAQSLQPYVATDGLLPPIGHDSIQVALGWVFAAYLAWTISEMILRRVGGKGDSLLNSARGTVPFSSRVFLIAGLASLFMLAVCYVMETTATTAGWWYWWALPAGNAIFGDVNMPAMEGWFSVVPDFLIPFLVIACAATTRGGLKWLWLLAFPLHLLGHLMYRWVPMAYLTYNVMEVTVVALAMFSRLRMGRGEMREAPGDRLSGALLAAALAIFFGVVALANLAAGEPAKILTALPMLMMCTLAWKRAPVSATVVLSAACCAGWWVIGPRALWALAPVAAFGFLRLLELRREALWLRLVPPVAAAALSATAVFLFEADLKRAQRFEDSWMQGDIATFERKPGAEEAYAASERERPREIGSYYLAVRRMMVINAEGDETAARVFEHRIPRLTRELEIIVCRDAEYVPPMQDLARFYLIEGRLDDAVAEARVIERLRPRDDNALVMLGCLLLRKGDVAGARPVLERALALRNPPAEAMVDLGVILFSERKDAEARRLWERALAADPRETTAQLNLDRPETGPRDVRDLRFLARPKDGEGLAPWVYGLARWGRDLSMQDRARLFEESAHLDPDFARPHAALAWRYLMNPGEDAATAREKALWHARRGVAISRKTGNRVDLAESLLALAHALAADSRPDEARRAAEEGRSIVPRAQSKPFDDLLDRLLPPK